MSEPLGGVTVEVKADLGKLETGLSSAKTRVDAFNQAAKASMQGVVTATTSAGSATDDLTAKQKALVAQLIAAKTTAKEAQAIFGATASSQKMLAAFTAQSTKAIKAQTVASEQQMIVWKKQAAAAREMAVAEERNAKFSAFMGVGGSGKSAAESAEVFAGKALGGFKLNRAGMQELGSIARHSFDQLAAGGSIMRVVGTHAASLGQAVSSAPGGLGGLLRMLATPAGLAGIAITAVGVAAVGTALAVDHLNAKLKELDDLSKGVGRSSGLTANQLNEIAKQGAVAGNTTRGQARDMAEALLETGQVGGKVFADLIAIQRRYAKATGEDLPAAQQELAKAVADPIKGLDLLNDKFGNLSASQQQAIRDAVAAGDTEKAQALVTAGLTNAVGGLSASLQGLGGAFDWAKNKAVNFGDAAAEAIKHAADLLAFGPTVAAQLEQQRAAAAAAGAQRATDNRTSGAGLELAHSLDPDFAARNQLKAQQEQLTASSASAQRQGDTAAYQAQAVALQNVTRARQTYLTVAEKAHALAELDTRANRVRAQVETTATRAEMGAIAAERTRVEMSGQVVSAADVEAAAKDNAAKASAKQQRASNSHAESLAREAKAMEANARGALAMASAYLVSDDAAMKAESARKADTSAERRGADRAGQQRRQLNLDIAERVASGAALAASTRQQAAAQHEANTRVLEGLQSSETSAQQMQQELAMSPLLVAQRVAQAAVTEAGTKATKDQVAALNAADAAVSAVRKAYAGLNIDMAEAATTTDLEAMGEEAARLNLEAKLLGATNRERDRELALLQAKQTLLRRNIPENSDIGKEFLGAVAGQASARNTFDEKKYLSDATKEIAAQSAALEAQQHALGMTHEAAAAYGYEQDHLIDLARRGVELNDEQRAALHNLALQYGATTEAARQLELQQRAAAEAAGFLADSVSNGLIDVLVDGKKASAAVRDLAKELERAVLRSALTGDGPFAGIMGTDKTAGPGQPNGGLLSGLFGKAFGVGKPDGTAANPIFVQSAGGAGGGGLFGGSANDNSGGSPWDERTRTTYGPNGPWDEVPWAGMGGGLWGDSVGGGPSLNFDGAGMGSGFNFLTDAGGQDFIASFSDVFQQNASGGFVGALKGLFGGGGAGGGSGVLGKLLGGLGGMGGSAGGAGGGGGGLGAFLGSVLATVAHDGLPAGATSTGRTRALPAGIFLSAPRLHDGLGPDEFPAVLQRGERVSSRRQVASEGRANAPVTIIVNAANADSFRKSDRQIATSLKRRLAVA